MMGSSPGPHLSGLRLRVLIICTALGLLSLVWTYRRTQQPGAAISISSPQAPSTILTYPQPPPQPSTEDLSSPRSPFIAWPLTRVCSETVFVPGLVFTCDDNSGGPGNIRNYILTCVRYAIAAGATGLVLPSIRTRSPDRLGELMSGPREPFGYMFDEAHFRAALGSACPQIAVYGALGDVPGILASTTTTTATTSAAAAAAAAVAEKIAPKELGSRGGCDPRDPNRHTDRFGDAFRAWLGETATARGLPPLSSDNPRAIGLRWGVLWDWPVNRDGAEFAATFGGLLRFREDAIKLGETICRGLLAAAAAASMAAEREGGGVSRGFLGVHLRTEEDALQAWPKYEVQAAGYIEEAKRRGFGRGVAYLASGNQTEARRFADMAGSDIQLDVRTKYDVLHGDDLEALKKLSWDQKALVDFVVLLYSDYFVGVSPSSFSINVALKRHLKDEGLYTRPWMVGGRGDGRSWIVGKYESYWDDWLFMYDGMWP
ncbi:hypothetical protein BX600DRAFT_432655 [Xylariales sp. PMI_506]|nr:hypothetical protein BX600DRAFT_432655 [Xylariales sp. PMI_506]